MARTTRTTNDGFYADERSPMLFTAAVVCVAGLGVCLIVLGCLVWEVWVR